MDDSKMESPLLKMQEQLIKEISCLDEVVDRLIDRLDPILVPFQEVDSKPENNPQEDNRSRVLNALDSQVAKVNRIKKRLVALTDRLEV